MAENTQQQAGDVLLILDKQKMLLQALAKTDAKGKTKTVPARPEHNNDFLRFNGSDDWLASFATNFWSQAKDPTRFTLLKLSDKQLEDPLVKRAMSDIEQGKITKDVLKFLKKYEVTSDDIKNSNNQKSKEMATEKNQGPASVEEQEPRRFRYNPAMIDWNHVESHGIARERLENHPAFEQMLYGRQSDDLWSIAGEGQGATHRYNAKISFGQRDDGWVELRTHPIKLAPEFNRPYLGHTFSEDDKINLTKTGNMGRTVPLRTQDGSYEDCFVTLDRETNRFYSAKVSKAFIGDEYSTVKLTDDEKRALKEGKPVHSTEFVSKKGNQFEATLQYNAQERRVAYIYDNNLKYGQEVGKVRLTNKQVDVYNAGGTIFVEDMVKKGTENELFSSFLKRNEVTGRMDYSRINPDDPTDVWVPKVIYGQEITSDERQALREGRIIPLDRMIDSQGEEFSSLVKLNPNTGFPMTSKTEDGFEHKSEFKIPAELFGVTPTATQRADLQDGKPVQFHGLKGNDGKTFSMWAEMNTTKNGINWYAENPVALREAAAARRAAQMQPQTPSVKADKKEEKKKGRRVA